MSSMGLNQGRKKKFLVIWRTFIFLVLVLLTVFGVIRRDLFLAAIAGFLVFGFIPE